MAHYQQVLRTVTYNNTSQNPNTTSRVIEFTANDGAAGQQPGHHHAVDHGGQRRAGEHGAGAQSVERRHAAGDQRDHGQ